MPKRQANAKWQGTLTKGQGHISVQSGAFDVAYSYGTRFEDQSGTNPEELIGAAHAGCFSMALSMMIEKAGFTPKEIHTQAEVSLEKVAEGFKITGIKLETEVEAPDMTDAQLQEQAESAKNNCPVSRALSGTEISLSAKLVS